MALCRVDGYKSLSTKVVPQIKNLSLIFKDRFFVFEPCRDPLFKRTNLNEKENHDYEN